MMFNHEEDICWLWNIHNYQQRRSNALLIHPSEFIFPVIAMVEFNTGMMVLTTILVNSHIAIENGHGNDGVVHWTHGDLPIRYVNVHQIDSEFFHQKRFVFFLHSFVGSPGGNEDNEFHFPTMWSPLTISWFMTQSNYDYIYIYTP